MILIRRILGPALILFTLLLVGLLGYFYISYQILFQREEQVYFSTLNEGFGSEVENKEIIALSLAQEMASNSEIQDAFASQDRARLLEAAEIYLERLKEFGVNEIHFNNPPAVSFLRVENPELYGDDLTGFRHMIVEVNRNQQTAVGFETSSSGFSVRGAVPVFHQGRFIGSLEVGIDAGRSLLDHFAEEYGNEWHVTLRQEALVQVAPNLLTSSRIGPSDQLILYASTSETPIYLDPQAYLRALAGEQVIESRRVNDRDYTIFIRPISDYSGNIIGTLDIVTDRTSAVAEQNTRLLIAGLAGFLVLFLASLGMIFSTTRTLEPIRSLTEAARNISGGGPAVQLEPSSKDEVGELTAAFNSMSGQLQESIASLELRVSERTRDLERRTLELEIISDVVREISIIRDPSTLQNVAVNLIRERMGYYHVGIFLLDERREFAILQAASGAGSARLLEQTHKVRISESDAAAKAFLEDQVFISQHNSGGFSLSSILMLPDSKAEILLPLRVQNVNLGGLNIHSNQAMQFIDRDIRTLRLLADQLAVAIENTRLAGQVEDTLAQLNRAYRAQTRDAWQEAGRKKQVTSYEYDGHQIRPVPLNLPAELVTQLDTGRPVLVRNIDQGTGSKDELETLLVPMMILGQLIGVIGIEQQDPTRGWTTADLAIAEAAATRAALTLENARLLEESQRRAVKEQTISEATSRISSALNIENILESTVTEIERVLGSSDVILQIRTNSPAAGQPGVKERS